MTNTVLYAALAAALAGPAIADQHTGDQMQSDKTSGIVQGQSAESLIRTSEIVGGELYTLDSQDRAEWGDTEYYDAVGDGWEQIGNVADVALSADGEMTGIIVEVGGFLDIGDATVLLNMDDAKLVAIDEDEEYHFVTRLSEEEIESLEEVEDNWW